jgi:tetratricopeptide (TPR) repeat protein
LTSDQERRDLILAEAQELAAAGRLADASRLCQGLIDDGAGGLPVDHLLGTINFQLGHLEEAIDRLERVAQARLDSASAQNDLGCCYFAVGRKDDAYELFRRALAADPAFAQANFNLGNIHRDDGDADEAERAYRQAVAIRPDLFEAHYNLGLVMIELGRFADAIGAFDDALEIEAGFADAHCGRGVALKALARTEEAAKSYRDALKCDPHHAAAAANLRAIDSGSLAELDDDEWPETLKTALEDARADPTSVEKHVKLGRALMDAGQILPAVRVFRRAAEISPQNVAALLGLGEALAMLGNPVEALAHYERVAALNPTSGMPWYSQAILYLRGERFEDGLRLLEKALELEPENARFRFARGSALLRLGRFEEGLPDWECHRKFNPVDPKDAESGVPIWDGSPMPSGHLLVTAEWGLGDVIMFSRFVPHLKRYASKVTYDVYPNVRHLMERMPGVDDLIESGDPCPAADARVKLVSLPYLLGTTMETIPTELDYLAVDEGRVEEFRTCLSHHDGIKVGLCWRGRVDFDSELGNVGRSLRLRYFAGVIRNPAVTPVALVKRAPNDELANSNLESRFVIFDRQLDGGDDAFIDTAPLIRNLDLVISCDTSVAHLAATLGCPVWLLLPLGSEWRWFLNRSDSPWYPEMRLFRQSRQNIWSDVILEVEQALEDLIQSRR